MTAIYEADSPPSREIRDLGYLVVAICAGIFIVVQAILVVAIVRGVFGIVLTVSRHRGIWIHGCRLDIVRRRIILLVVGCL